MFGNTGISVFKKDNPVYRYWYRYFVQWCC